jgi:hypothetical protein
MPDRGRTALPSPSDTPSTATDKAATAAPLKADKPPLPAGAKPATTVPPPTPPEVPGNPEGARLMARANVLLSQGNVGAARIVLERAAELGKASALFALADVRSGRPVGMGTVGTQADVAKARELYGRAQPAVFARPGSIERVAAMKDSRAAKPRRQILTLVHTSH